MKRKLSARAVRPDSRQLIWQRIRQLGRNGAEFSFKRLYFAGPEDRALVKEYLRLLVLGGFVEMSRRQRGTVRSLYRLTQDIGINAPRITGEGRIAVRGRKSEQLWQTMRLLPDFTARDLAITASVEGSPINLRSANNYCVLLAKVGYLQIVEAAIPARKRSAVYRLIKARNTGPLPPSPRRFRDAIWDPNIDKIVSRAEPLT